MESPFNQIALRSPFFDTGVSVFTPLSLFSASEPGAWYDPSDMSTMFQDFNGATPVTAVEQPVSVLLDKSKNGVGTNGTRRLNLVTYSEQFDNAAWTKGNVTISANTTATTDPLGGNTADRVVETTVNSTHSVVVNYTTTAAAHKFSIYAKAGERSWIAIGMGPANTGIYFNLSNGTVGTVGSAITSYSITDAGNGWYQISATCTYTASVFQIGVYVATADNTASYAGNTSNGLYIWGADLRLAADANIAPTYQRVTDTWYNVQAGSHAYTPSAATASRPVLSARVNVLSRTEEFSDAAWGKSNVVVTANATTAPNGTLTASLLSGFGLGANATLTGQVGVVTSGSTVTASIYVKANDLQFIQFATNNVSDGYANFNVSTGVAGTFTGTFSNPTATNAGNGWFLLSVRLTGIFGTTILFDLISSNTAGRAPAFSATTGLYIWGADLRVANDGVNIPVYQRVSTSTNYDTTNFPMYLRFDGSDDYMLTGTITPGTDKAQVFAGVRKLSDAAAGILVETSATRASNAGAFTFFAPGAAASPTYLFTTRGSIDPTSTTGASTFTSPITNIVTGLGDISADLDNIRVNGTVFVVSTSDQGTGNYLAYPMYIGRRGGTSLPYNGRLFGLIVRFGANLTDTQITNTETWMNGKTKAY